MGCVPLALSLRDVEKIPEERCHSFCPSLVLSYASSPLAHGMEGWAVLIAILAILRAKLCF